MDYNEIYFQARTFCAFVLLLLATLAYDALPITATPSEFLCGHGNWGLTETEAKCAIALANIIEQELP